MQKARAYDWKDSNMALFGSDAEKKVKNQSAETKPAWQAAKPAEVGLVIWRIVKFKVTSWDKDSYGDFYNGDSYIILNKYKDEDEDVIKMDVHFWIGKYSTQDEYGTAAYKTVELDTFLDDIPVQHREVMGHESRLFKSYFESIAYLKGGADTGFRQVLPKGYVPRLFHIYKDEGKRLIVNEVSAKAGNVTDDDCFFWDAGHDIYSYIGRNCSADEKFKTAQEVKRLEKSRGSVRTIVEEFDQFIQHIPDGEASKSKKKVYKMKSKLFKVSDADGKLDMAEIEGDASKDHLSSDDVFLLETSDHMFVWVGNGASIDEKRNGLSYGSNHLNKTEAPCRPITVIAEGKENAEFNAAF